ncbi:hypothetical protein KM043_001762 [Ampulex compressa]|nr:hypothetical protein KM043_001762 [Ampulex compressa]
MFLSRRRIYNARILYRSPSHPLPQPSSATRVWLAPKASVARPAKVTDVEPARRKESAVKIETNFFHLALCSATCNGTLCEDSELSRDEAALKSFVRPTRDSSIAKSMRDE